MAKTEVWAQDTNPNLTGYVEVKKDGNGEAKLRVTGKLAKELFDGGQTLLGSFESEDKDVANRINGPWECFKYRQTVSFRVGNLVMRSVALVDGVYYSCDTTMDNRVRLLSLE